MEVIDESRIFFVPARLVHPFKYGPPACRPPRLAAYNPLSENLVKRKLKIVLTHPCGYFSVTVRGVSFYTNYEVIKFLFKYLNRVSGTIAPLSCLCLADFQVQWDTHSKQQK